MPIMSTAHIHMSTYIHMHIQCPQSQTETESGLTGPNNTDVQGMHRQSAAKYYGDAPSIITVISSKDCHSTSEYQRPYCKQDKSSSPPCHQVSFRRWSFFYRKLTAPIQRT